MTSIIVLACRSVSLSLSYGRYNIEQSYIYIVYFIISAASECVLNDAPFVFFVVRQPHIMNCLSIAINTPLSSNVSFVYD